MGATFWTWNCWGRGRRFDVDVGGEAELKRAEFSFGISVEESVVTNAPESFGQDMLEYEMEEMNGGHGPGFAQVCATFAVREGDVAVLVADDVVFADDAPIEVF